MTRVLVAVDETEASVRAAEVARRLFGDAEYVAVSVADLDLDGESVPWWRSAWGLAYPVPYGAVWPLLFLVGAAPEEDGGDTATEAAQEEARTVADQSGLSRAEAVGEVGDPAEVITRVAEERAVDVIVVGTHERGWFDRLLHPSVGDDVLKESEIPVLVVK